VEKISIRVDVEREGDHESRAGDYVPDGIFRTQVPSACRRIWPDAAALRGEFRVDIREHDDEVIVVADLPGVEKENVSLQLINPGTLEIPGERERRKRGKIRRLLCPGTDVWINATDGSIAC